MAKLLSVGHKSKLSDLESAKLFNDLHSKIDSEGLMDRDYLYYGGLGILTLLSLVLFAYLIYIANNLFLVLILAISFGIILGQVAGFMHDGGHRSIFKSHFWNDVVGNIAAFILFVNYNAWNQYHNMHHAFPNQYGKDPDMNQPILSFTPETAKSLGKFGRMFFPYQAYLYFPMSSLLAYSLHFKISFVHFVLQVKKGIIWKSILEVVVLLPSFFVWYILPFLIFDISKALILVLVIPLTIGFYMANVFAPNHKGMDEVAPDVHIPFMEQQITTSRNLKPGWLTDFIYIGLNYQIEHHLFPICSRSKYHKIAPHIKELCQKAGFEYRENSIYESNFQILSNLKQISDEVKIV